MKENMVRLVHRLQIEGFFLTFLACRFATDSANFPAYLITF